MAQARQADRAFPPTAIYLAAAALAAVVLTAVISIGMLDLFGGQSSSGGGTGVSPAVLESGRQWELQRKAQSGYVDPVLQSGRDWEKQRRQQSGE